MYHKTTATTNTYTYNSAGMTSIENPIYYGSRGDDFKTFVDNILKRGKVKEKFLTPLLTDKAYSLYNMALTSKTADTINNYEFYEQLGDVLVNKIIVVYMYKRFPQLKKSEYVKVVARLRIKYVSKAMFNLFANKLGFWNFISASEDEKLKSREDLMEDSFEAFMGVTEEILDEAFTNGVGYNVVYDIIASVLDEEPISLKFEDLFDAKTRLKEIFDVPAFKPNLGNDPVYDEEIQGDKRYINVYAFVKPFDRKDKKFRYQRDKIIGRAEITRGPKEAEQRAAEIAIETLARLRYIKPIPELYLNLKS